jgi:molecular chaperone GrpE (heat shock protein)
MKERTETVAQRQIDDILRTVDHLNLTTHWAQTKATDDQLEQISDSLLLAMHDLRTVLTRKKAERVLAAQAAAENTGN